ncbi:MAG TPA: transporter [Xanthomonadaceae bacterium]|jgi:hypothetical protein|nr:transporter [Xanthomonadaceae bacterium]
MLLRCACAAALGLAFATSAFADDAAPSFDRPGFGFASSVLPAGSFDWEQGLPDMERDSGDGAHSTFYTADTEVRVGIGSNLELQLHTSAWNELDFHAPGASGSVSGAGDTALGLKWAPPLSSKDWTLSVLGLVSFDTGSNDFTAGHDVATLALEATRDLGGGHTLAFNATVNHGDGQTTWSAAANFGFPIQGNLSGYMQAGHFGGDGIDSSLAGAGLVWLIGNRVQFDLGANAGLTNRSPDYQAGFGISVFWK